MGDVIAVYADGGLLKVNPSPIGGMWATCHVNAAGEMVWSDSGLVLAEVGDPFLSTVSNNVTEFRALLAGLEVLPDGWSGRACSDSLVTIRRFRDDAGLAGIPIEWRRRMAVVLGRLGQIEYVLLDGHPSRAQLAEQEKLGEWVAGAGKRGNPVSKWNRWCDERCTEIGRAYLGVEPKPKRAKKEAAA